VFLAAVTLLIVIGPDARIPAPATPVPLLCEKSLLLI